MTTSVSIAPETLARYVEQLGAIGRVPDGGLVRPVYSPPWAEARRQVAAWMEEIGLAVREDAVGNLFGRLEGRQQPERVVLTGSHVDTVPHGGAYDGATGIHAALAAVGALAASLGRPRKSLEVLAMCEEEGSRFACNFWGARAITGTIAADEAERLRDLDGVTIGDAMRAYGFDPARIPDARRTDLDAFLELHIEQGRIMQDAGVRVGVVRTITGQYRAEATVEGRPDHAGGTPMDLRRDAYLGAAEMALGSAAVAEQMGRPAVATVGRVRLEPGAINVVPGRARFTLDARHPDGERLRALLDGIQRVCAEAAGRRGLSLAWGPAILEEPTPLDEGLQRLLERCADDLGERWMPMTSGAGHDSEILARQVPTAMLFVPSHEGRSHSPDEYTAVEDMLPGVRVLAEALRRLAYA